MRGLGPQTSPPVQRASATDLAFLAMDTGQVPEQFGVLLELDGHLTLPQVRELVAGRLVAQPRLRQRLVDVPFGCGGPIWVDAALDLDAQVRAVPCPGPADAQALVDAALAQVLRPLPRDAPLWSVVLLDGPPDGRSALVVVLHHALADGIGGLNVLAALVDPGSEPGGEPGGEPGDAALPRPCPSTAVLLRDSLASKTKALLGLSARWRLLRSSLGAGGGLRPPRAAPCSLVRPTGPRRRAVMVHTEHDALRAAAHRRGATTNDAVLVAVAGALGDVLAARGEHVDPLVVTVPVSGRAAAPDRELGNLVSPMLVPVPTTGTLDERLARVAATTRAGKSDAAGPPPIALLGWVFRPLAALGGYRWYLRHQRRFHTLVSHLRGPAGPVSFGGLRVRSAVPLGVAEGGNVTVYVQALSYDGTLTVTAIVDPDWFPDTELLRDALEARLRALGAS